MPRLSTGSANPSLWLHAAAWGAGYAISAPFSTVRGRSRPMRACFLALCSQSLSFVRPRRRLSSFFHVPTTDLLRRRAQGGSQGPAGTLPVRHLRRFQAVALAAPSTVGPSVGRGAKQAASVPRSSTRQNRWFLINFTPLVTRRQHRPDATTCECLLVSELTRGTAEANKSDPERSIQDAAEKRSAPIWSAWSRQPL